MPTSRLEAFSDGVFAIAITLLVLEIKVPEGAGNDLPHQLAEQWPSYASYLDAARDGRLLGIDLSEDEIRRRTFRFRIGGPIYALAALVALVSAPACLAINAALAVYYAHPRGGMMPSPSS